MIEHIVGKIPGLAKPRRKFLVMVLRTILMMRGRVNYTNLSRYSEYSERTFRRQYVKAMEFGEVNHLIVSELKMEEQTLVLAMDATFVGKSGKHTPGLGRFWNGSEGRAEKGLEVSLAAVVNVETKTAYALEARQTVVSAKVEKESAPAVGGERQEAVSVKVEPKSKTKAKTKSKAAAKPGVKPGRLSQWKPYRSKPNRNQRPKRRPNQRPP